MNVEHPLQGAEDEWDALIADMEATAEEYATADWEPLELHTADVTVTDAGIDVLIGDAEFDRLRAVAETATFDSCEVYNRAAAGVVLALVVFEANPAATAVLVPLYYRLSEASDLATREQVRLRVRRLDETDLWFTVDRPALFVPDGD